MKLKFYRVRMHPSYLYLIFSVYKLSSISNLSDKRNDDYFIIIKDCE